MSLLGDIKDVGSAIFEIGKAAKGLIGNADKLAGGLRGIGSLFQRFSTVGRLTDLARLGRKLSEYGDDALRFLANPEIKKFLKRAKTPILLGGQTTIAGMKLTTGFGSPDDGERFGEGASRFTAAGGTLADAQPNDSWTGAGSESYSKANSRQIARTKTMTAADQAVNAVLVCEAEQIIATRAVLDEQSDWLADVGLVTMLVAATPFVGQGASLAMEIAAVTKALGACTMQLTELAQQVNSNAAQIQQTAGRYGQRSGMSNMSRTTPDPKPPSPPPPGGENGDAPGDTDTVADEPAPDGTGPGAEGTDSEGTGSGSGSGGSGSGGGPGSAGESSDAMPSDSEMPESETPEMPAPPAAAASPGLSGGGASPGGLASPLSSLPAAAAGAMPAAATAGLSAAQITALVQAAVQKAMEAERAKEDTDGDGILDDDEDENRDGIPDVEQDQEQETEVDGTPDEVGAGPGAPAGGRAPVDFAVDVDAAGRTSPIAVSFERNDRIGSPSPAEQ